MHFRKRSFGYRPCRSRLGIRWSGLFLFISIALLLFYSSAFYDSILASPSLLPSHSSCPAIPPYPSLVSTPSGSNWRNILTRFPVDTLAQLPPRTAKQSFKIQHDFGNKQSPPTHNLERIRQRAAVKATFLRSWTTYKAHAWKQDILLPLSNSSKSTLGGWGLTLVSSLSTLWLMDLKDEFNDAVAAVSEIDFAPQDTDLDVAKVATHYLSGLLSAYDLTACRDTRLLHKAMELGDMLYVAFDTPNRLPILHYDPLKAAAGEVQQSTKHGSLADLTAFLLPFTRLSQLTGDMRFYDAVIRISTLLSTQQASTLVPGLWPSTIDILHANLTAGTTFPSHSAYAAILSTAQLLHLTPAAQPYTTLTSLAISALLPTLLFRPITPSNTDILAPTTAHISPTHSLTRDHTITSSSCFLGATLALASRILHNTTLLPYARRVTESCIWAHAAAPHGLMPNSFTLLACASSSPANDGEDCTFDPDVWPAQVHPGFETVEDGRYEMGLETVLSVWMMYRVTGEEQWRDVGWELFRAIEEGTRVEGGGSAVVQDVMHEESGLEREDEMPSVWMGGTLKLFYLLFSEEDVGSLDEWVVGEGGQMFRLQ